MSARRPTRPKLPAQPLVPKPYTALPNSVLDSDLSKNAKVTLWAMRSRAYRSAGGICKASQEDLAKLASSSEDAITKAQRELLAAGWIALNKKGGGGWGIKRTTWWVVYDMPQPQNTAVKSLPQNAVVRSRKTRECSPSHSRKTRDEEGDSLLSLTGKGEANGVAAVPLLREQDLSSVPSGDASDGALTEGLALMADNVHRLDDFQRGVMVSVQAALSARKPVSPKQRDIIRRAVDVLKMPAPGRNPLMHGLGDGKPDEAYLDRLKVAMGQMTREEAAARRAARAAAI